MKTKNKILLLTSTLAILPFVSVVSCSNNSNTNQPNNEKPPTNIPENKPEKEPELLDFTVDIPKISYEKDGWSSVGDRSLIDWEYLTKIKENVENGKIKIEDENGNPIQYQIEIKAEGLNGGIKFSEKDYTDINKPYSNKIENMNIWKTISEPINVSKVFNFVDLIKSANDIGSDHWNLIVETSLENTIAKYNEKGRVGNFLSFDLVFRTTNNSPWKSCLDFDGQSYFGEKEFNKHKNKFSNKDSQTLNYFYYPEKEEEMDKDIYVPCVTCLCAYITDIFGTVSIKPLKN